MQQKGLTRVVQTLLVPAPTPTLASPRGRAALTDFRLLFRSCKEKKKKLQERNQGEWVCCSGDFVQITPFRRLLLGYKQDVFFCESFVSNLLGLEGLLL